jgi:hypothetical protein
MTLSETNDRNKSHCYADYHRPSQFLTLTSLLRQVSNFIFKPLKIIYALSKVLPEMVIITSLVTIILKIH